MGLFNIFKKEEPINYNKEMKDTVTGWIKGNGINIYSPISDEEGNKLINTYGYKSDYIDFLKFSNGFLDEGYKIFGISDLEMDDVIYNNNFLQKELNSNNYLLVGETEIDFFVYNKELDKYQVLLKLDHQVKREFPDFYTMFYFYIIRENIY